MRRPRMSTGAWVFATAVLVLAVAAPVSYAAATSTVAIGNTSGSTTALVDPEKQLLTTTVSPSKVVHFWVTSGTQGCTAVYTPPSGDALVITDINYDLFLNGAGQMFYALTTDGTCEFTYDEADTDQADDTIDQTFATGLPVPSVGIYIHSAPGYQGHAEINYTGYLIPVHQLPPENQEPHVSTRQLVKVHAATH